MQNESRLAVLGAGHVGPVIARLAIGAGRKVKPIAKLPERILSIELKCKLFVGGKSHRHCLTEREKFATD